MAAADATTEKLMAAAKAYAAQSRDPPPGAVAVRPPPADPRARAFWEILTRATADQVEAALARSGLVPRPEDVEEVLRHVYPNPSAAVKFFRWSGQSIKHTPYAWNLMVDILGKQGFFDHMWDAIRSMKQENALSTATFASAFSSYCDKSRIKEALMTFDVMDRYDTPQDVVAVNSLLSAICRQPNGPGPASDFFDSVKARIPPDADTFAILLEGWEKEGNVARAKSTFGEMVVRIGWAPENVPAYDAFLTTLVRAAQTGEALNFLKVMKSKGCLPTLKFLGAALEALVRAGDTPNAIALWDIMVDNSGVVPDINMYNSIIALLCNAGQIDAAYTLLDSMPFKGSFPNYVTYNTIFECLLRNRRARDAHRFLTEMRKNEEPPSLTNCVTAIRLFFDDFNPSAACEVWSCIVEERVSPNGPAANELLLGLRDLGRMSEVNKYAEEMLDMEVELNSTTMEKLKTAFGKEGKFDAYDRFTKRMKRH